MQFTAAKKQVLSWHNICVLTEFALRAGFEERKSMIAILMKMLYSGVTIGGAYAVKKYKRCPGGH